MPDTSYIVTDAIRPRLVRLSPEVLSPDGVGYPMALATPDGAGSIRSTGRDMAHFGQMFLERGGVGAGRVLSPASVAAMTRNQIPGIGAQFGEERFPEASWGLGWAIRGSASYPKSTSLPSSATCWHSGAGGAHIWIDPVYDLVGVYCSIEPHPLSDEFHVWPLDLFANAVTAAVLDP